MLVQEDQAVVLKKELDMTQERSLMKTVHLAQSHDLQLVMKYFVKFEAHQVEKRKKNALFLRYYCPNSSEY